MMTATEIAALRTKIQTSFAQAIKSGTGAVVEVTMAHDTLWTISGDRAQVERAAPVLLAAGMTLESVEHDAELAESFAYWRAAA